MHAKTGPRKILVVEDSEVQAVLLTRLLGKKGYEVLSARNGVEAIAKVKARPPDIIVSDVIMPLMDGYAMCRELKLDERLCHIPVLLLTELTDIQGVIMGLESFADAYLTKPYDEEVLVGKIEYLLRCPAVNNATHREEPIPVDFDGREYRFSSSRRQILNFLLFTYENAVRQFRELEKAQRELRSLNALLEEKVRERTAAMLAEATERIQAEKGLKETERKFHAMADMAVAAVVTVDGTGTVGYWNRAAEKMFGYTSAEAVGKNIHALITPERYHATAKAGLERFKNTGEGKLIGNIYEMEAVDKQGKLFPVQISLSAFQHDGKWNAVAMVQDITERAKWEVSLTETNKRLENAMEDLKKTQAMLVRSEKLASLGHLAAGVAHEIKNPLNIISTSVQFLMMGDGVTAEAKEMYATMSAQITRITKIIDNLRDFARDRKPEVKELNVVDLIEKTAALVEYEMRVGGIDLFQTHRSGPLYVKADADQLAQVFLNMVNNARDSLAEVITKSTYDERRASGWHARLNIETERGEGWAHIRFRDNGTGIPHPVMNRIFDPFFTTKAEGKGTGLGLSISMGIIEAHGGKVEVVNGREHGAEFVIKLPLSDTDGGERNG